MATLVKGAFGDHLPWGLLGLGGAIALLAEGAGLGGLAFSIGLYLPGWPLRLPSSSGRSSSSCSSGARSRRLPAGRRDRHAPQLGYGRGLRADGYRRGPFLGVAAGGGKSPGSRRSGGYRITPRCGTLGDNAFEDALTITPFAVSSALTCGASRTAQIERSGPPSPAKRRGG